MEPRAGRTLLLLDAQQRQLGQITIERIEGGLIFGKFLPGPAYPAVEHLFHAFEQAADSQALSVVDELDRAIAALGLHFRSPGGAEGTLVHDVQIWSDGGVTCRLTGPTASGGNGSAAAAQAVQPAPG
jgi:hypothetical protein